MSEETTVKTTNDADKEKKGGVSALIGVNFSLLNTKLRAAYEKKGSDGYAVLLIPSEQNADNSINIGEVIADISKLTGAGVGDTSVSDSLTKSLEAVKPEGEKGSNWMDKIALKLQMAFLYIKKEKDKDAVVEYAFKLDILTEGLVPDEIKKLVDVQNISISVWSTERQKVLDQMALITIGDYLGESPKLTDNQAV